jgi:hypothetical protein
MMHSVCEPFVRLPPFFEERQTRPSPSADGGSEWRATAPGCPEKIVRIRREGADEPDLFQKSCFERHPLHG